MTVDLHTHAPLHWLMADYHEGVRPDGAPARPAGIETRATEGTALPRVPEGVIEEIIGRDSLALLGLVPSP